MIYINCPLCGGDDSTLVVRENGYHIVACDICGMVYLNPRPDDSCLQAYYQKSLPFDEKSIVAWQNLTWGVVKRAIQTLDRLKPAKGKLLDIGCRYGSFLDLAKKHGWDTVGIDICSQAVSYDRWKGLNVGTKDLVDRSFADNGFDAVTMFYVLERMPDPMQCLKQIQRILAPGGVLLIRTPETTPIVKFFKVMNLFRPLYEAPGHLNDFSPRTLKSMLEKAGFQDVKCMIGGFTLPYQPVRRVISWSSGCLAETLYLISAGRLLLPGVSKTTIAFKPRGDHG